MTQALQTEDSTLPQFLTIQNAYTELWKGSKYIVVVVRKGQSHGCNCSAGNTTGDQGARGGLDGPQDPHSSNLTTRQMESKLFKELDLSGLNSWPFELAEAAHQLLAEYHDVFFARTHGAGLHSLY